MRTLDTTGVKNWASACVASLRTLYPAINDINVYPVADGDTGSNLLHTMIGAQEELLAQPVMDRVDDALAALAKGAAGQARGNSGVILSQILRGFAQALHGHKVLGAQELVAAFRQADVLAVEAVAVPVDGTMLSVVHAVAIALEDAHAAGLDSFQELVKHLADVAGRALERTPFQLPVLAQTGVVDAGGRGLVAILDALSGVVSGASSVDIVPIVEQPNQASRCGLPADRMWEVMYHLDEAEPSSIPNLKLRLRQLGDSVTIANDGADSYLIHVHTENIGAALEAGVELGIVRKIRVEPVFGEPRHKNTAQVAPSIDRSVVALVRDASLANLIRAERVAVLVMGSLNVDLYADLENQLTRLILEAESSHVTVLPEDKVLTKFAEQVLKGEALAADRDAVVIPCVSPVQVLSALAVHDVSRRSGDDVVAMAEAAAATRRGEISYAEEEALTWIGKAQAGDLLGLVDGEVAFIEPVDRSRDGLLSLSTKVLSRMLAAGGELVTVLLGVEVPTSVGEQLAEYAYTEHPEVEFVSYPGGHEGMVVLIGVE